MPRIVSINAISNGSTGTIAQIITDYMKKQGYESYFACGRGKQNNADYKINRNLFFLRINSILARLTGKQGHFNYFATKKFIKWLEKIKPDIIHIHTIHGEYINTNLLFKFISKMNIKVVWTFHDCWPFTGHCPYFDVIKCQKWETHCEKCSQSRIYPKSWIFDCSKKEFTWKKHIFSSVENLTIVTPSKWLGDLVNRSFLRNRDPAVINNGIDFSKFHYRDSEHLRVNMHLEGKIILLCVAGPWNLYKNLKAFNLLADMLDDRFKIILVGIKKEKLNEKIISFPRVDFNTLCDLYSLADYFVNPTISDNFPTVNLEAQACGLPIIAYNTGGCPEQISSKSGIIVPKNDLNALKNAIESLPKFDRNDCIENARMFSNEKMAKKYHNLFVSILEEKSK